MKQIIALVVLVLSFGSIAKAGILLEPYLGYASYTQDISLVSGSDASSKTTGLEYGARVGYTFPALFWLAAEYTQNPTTTVKYDAAGRADADANRTAYGATFGLDLPILLRVWAGYIVSDSITVKNSSASDTYTGTGYKAGVGFTGLPFVSLNLEYVTSKYNKASGSSYNVLPYDSLVSNFENKGLVFSVSIPFNL